MFEDLKKQLTERSVDKGCGYDVEDKFSLQSAKKLLNHVTNKLVSVYYWIWFLVIPGLKSFDW